MRKLVVLALLIPGVAIARSPFDGVWKTNLDSMQFSGKPDVYALSDDIFECRSCVPPYKIKADGTDQPVPENASRDHAAVKVLSPLSIELTTRRNGRIVFVVTMTVSGDGSRLVAKFTSHLSEGTVSGDYTEKRVGTAPPRSHPISGSWQQVSVSDVSDVARSLTLQASPNGMTMKWNTMSLEAEFDGKEYLLVGDPGRTLVTLRKLSDNEFEETDRLQGKVVNVIVYTLAKNGKTIHVVDTDPVHGTTTSYDLERR